MMGIFYLYNILFLFYVDTVYFFIKEYVFLIIINF